MDVFNKLHLLSASVDFSLVVEVQAMGIIIISFFFYFLYLKHSLAVIEIHNL